MSKFGAFNSPSIRNGGSYDSEEDYGAFDAVYTAAVSSDSPTINRPKSMKKKLSKYDHFLDAKITENNSTTTSPSNPVNRFSDDDDDEYGEIEYDPTLPSSDQRNPTNNNRDSITRKKFQSKIQQQLQQQLPSTRSGQSDDEEEYGTVVEPIKLPNATLPPTHPKGMKKTLSKYSGFQDAPATTAVASSSGNGVVPMASASNQSIDSDEEEYGVILPETPQKSTPILPISSTQGNGMIRKSLSKYNGFDDAPILQPKLISNTSSTEMLAPSKASTIVMISPVPEYDSDNDEYGDVEKE